MSRSPSSSARAFRLLLVLLASASANCCVAQDATAQESAIPAGPDAATTPLVPLISQPTVAAAPAPLPSPFAGPLMERKYLGGDWAGARSGFLENGITFDISSTQYYQGVAAGGLNQAFEYGGRGDYLVNINGEKVGLQKGFFIDLHAETRYGESANNLTGTLLPPNLMLALPLPNGTVTALTGVKFTQFLSEDFLVFAGKLNMFDGFRQQLTGAKGIEGFLNTSLMFNPIYIRTVPYSTLGAGFAYLQNQEAIFSFVVVDTNNTPTVSGFSTFFNNGATMLWQLNVPTQFWELPGHQGLSGTYSSGTYQNLQGSPYLNPDTGGLIVPFGADTGSWCFAYNFDQALYVAPDDPRRVWGLFGNLGVADGSPSPIRWFSNVGLSGASPLANRKLDTFGIGYSYLGVSDRLKSASTFIPLQNEQAVELFYNYAVTPWFRVTPDLQILDPFQKGPNTALLVGMRAKVDF